jgi:hypothetical protein
MVLQQERATMQRRQANQELQVCSPHVPAIVRPSKGFPGRIVANLALHILHMPLFIVFTSVYTNLTSCWIGDCKENGQVMAARALLACLCFH